MEIKKIILKKEIEPLKDGTFLETVTKQTIRDRESLENMLDKIDKVVNPLFAKTEEARIKQTSINEKEKEGIRKALKGEKATIIHDL